jgi:uncharacterized membrane protein
MMPFAFGDSRWRNALLLASLCLNILLAAFIFTRWIERGVGPLVAAAPPQLIEFMARRLPAGDADILRRVYRSREEQFTANQREFRLALLTAGKLLSQPQLDVAALRAAVTEARDRRIAIGDLAIETFLETLPQISAEGRRGLTASIRPR